MLSLSGDNVNSNLIGKFFTLVNFLAMTLIGTIGLIGKALELQHYEQARGYTLLAVLLFVMYVICILPGVIKYVGLAVAEVKKSLTKVN